MKIKNLRDFYVNELRDLFNAENQLTKALPKMAKAATNPDLKAGFEQHLEETRGHIARLEEIFQGLGVSPKGKTCKAMEGLVAEGAETIQEDMPDTVKDAALIAAAQRVEHYEIAGYGCVRTYARLLGEEDAVALLEQTLEEEAACDEKLTELAESGVNDEANEEDEEEEEEEGDEGEEEEDEEDEEEAPVAAKPRAKSRASR